MPSINNSQQSVITQTQRYKQTELAGTVEKQDAGYGVSVQTRGAKTLLTLTVDKIKRPASITANQPSTWHIKNNQADMLIITPQAFTQSIVHVESVARESRIEDVNS